jgi:hypothetical protein
MAVGFQITKPDLDTNIGSISRSVNQWAENITRYKATVDGLSEQDLEKLGYTPDDVALLKSAVNDLGHLARIYYGQDEQTPAYDFRTFSLRLAGLII